MEKEKKDLLSQLEQNQTLLKNLEAELTQANQEKSELSWERQVLKDKQQSLSEELTQSKIQIVGLTEQLNKIKRDQEKQQASLKKQNQTLLKSLQACKEKLLPVEEIHYKYKQEKEGLLTQLKQSKQANEQLNQKYQSLKADYEKLFKQLTEVSDKYAALEKEKESLVTMLKHAENLMANQALTLQTQGDIKQEGYLQQGYEGKKQYIQKISEVNWKYKHLEQKYKELMEQNRLLKGKYPDENAILHYNLGVLYTQNQNYDKAIFEFKKVLELKPDDAEANYNLGVIYGEYLNDRREAINYFKRYLALAPNDVDADRARKYILTWETFDQE